MRHILPFVLLSCLFFGCEKDTPDPPNPNILEGTWFLVEVLFDPGDGSGVFEPSDAGFEITLKADNTFVANFHVCRIFEAGERRSGAFTRIAEQELLIPCDGSINNSIQGRLESGKLIFYYPCIEPCVYKFEKKKGPKE